MVGANSPSSLASRPIRILLADEIDRYPATAGNEGDPLLLAGKRLATFWNKKEVCVSTPTNKETSRIAVEFEHSTQEEWNVPCPACGAFTPLLWANIVFDRDKLDEIGCTCPAMRRCFKRNGVERTVHQRKIRRGPPGTKGSGLPPERPCFPVRRLAGNR